MQPLSLACREASSPCPQWPLRRLQGLPFFLNGHQSCWIQASPPPKKKVASFQRNHLFRESHLQIRLRAEVLGTGAPTYDFRGNILQPIMVPTLLTLQIRMLRPERLSKLPEFPQLVSVEPGTEADLETRMLLPPPPYWVLSLSPVPSRCHLTSSGLGFHSPMAPPPPLVSGYPDSVCRSTYTATCCSSVWTIE